MMIERFTHDERRSRRQKIADYARDHSDGETASKFGVTIPTVRKARMENGVHKPNCRGLPPSSYGIVAGLIRGQPMADVARQFKVSRQFVKQIQQRMQKHGVFDAIAEIASKNAVDVLKAYQSCVQDVDRLSRKKV